VASGVVAYLIRDRHKKEKKKMSTVNVSTPRAVCSCRISSYCTRSHARSVLSVSYIRGNCLRQHVDQRAAFAILALASEFR